MSISRVALPAALLLSISVFAQVAPPPGAQGQYDPNAGGGPNAAEPPDEAGPGVARISLLDGEVSVRRGDSTEPVAAAMNAPMLVGDTIATGRAARAEVQFDLANRFRLGNEGEARLAVLEPNHYRLELARGTASVSVIRESQAQIEVSTPVVSLRALHPGLYRVWVRDDGETVITIRSGEAEIYTQKGTEHLGQGQTMFVRGNPQDPEFQVVAAGQTDAWDSWNEQRDQMLLRSRSSNYVNPGVTGAEDLDAYGTWTNDPQYGEVWAPRVDPGWAPYSAGRWAWEDYYGWTWVSSDPWGWAPYHYGSWYRGSVGWCWYPGAIGRPVFWRPALVAFFGFGGGGFGIGFGGFGGIGWLPLAPFEVFHPWYGRGLFAGGWGGRGFNGNIHINNVNITNIYRNARVNGAVSGLAANSFANGQFNRINRLQPNQLRSAGLVRGAVPLAPTQNSLRFNDRAATVVPRAINNAHFTAPTPAASVQRASFEQQRQGIQSRFSSPSASLNSSSGLRSQSAVMPRTQVAPTGASSWGRFGTPNRSAAPAGIGAAQSRPYSPSSPGSSAPGWNRFGTPNPGAPASRSAAPSASRANSGWNHYVSSQAYPSGPARGFSSNGASQPLRVSPSIVHDRSYDRPSVNTGGYNSGRSGYNPPPAYSSGRSSGYNPAPAYGSGRSSGYNPAPAYGSGRSTGYNPAPAYSSPRSYSAPPSTRQSAPSGGGGSSHPSAAPSGGGHSSGGGGGGHSSGGGGGGHHGR